MMLFAFLPYIALLDFSTNGNRFTEKQRFFLLSVGLFFGVWTHDFTTLFFICLFLSLIAWVTLNRTKLDRIQRNEFNRIFFLFLGILSIGGGLSLLRMQALKKVGGWVGNQDPFAWMLPENIDNLLQLLSFSFTWQVKVLLATVAFVFILSQLKFRWKFDFKLQTLVISFLFMFSLLCALKTSVIESRMLLAFLVPILLAITELVSSIVRKNSRVAMSVALFFLLVIPAFSQKGYGEGDFFQYWSRHEEFGYLVSQSTRSVDKKCVTASGYPGLVRTIENVYLNENPTEVGACSDRFHIHFEMDPHEFLESKGDLNRVNPRDGISISLEDFFLIYKDKDGRSLFAKVSP